MKKPKPPPIVEDAAPGLSEFERETRDQIANQVMVICMHNLSRQMSDGSVKPEDFGIAIETVARVSYSMADAMRRWRDAKAKP